LLLIIKVGIWKGRDRSRRRVTLVHRLFNINKTCTYDQVRPFQREMGPCSCGVGRKLNLLGRKKKEKVHTGKCYRILARECGPYLAKIQKKKNSGRHYSLQVRDLQKYKPTLSFISPQKFSLSPKSYSLPP
jgi:hypothetical protein